jgi:hypothetical protein
LTTKPETQFDVTIRDNSCRNSWQDPTSLPQLFSKSYRARLLAGRPAFSASESKVGPAIAVESIDRNGVRTVAHGDLFGEKLAARWESGSPGGQFM